MDEVENIGKKLKQLRTERDLTLDMVVYSIGQEYNIEFTKGNLSRWENGINLPSLRLAAYLAKFYGVSLDYLIGNTDVRTPTNLLAIKKKKGE
jgi:transcriptional regulator with XRE-family HTH domain